MADRLMCAHRGDNDENLYWCTYNGSFWTGDTQFSNGAKSTSAPALCVFNGILYCVHRGNSGNNNLWYCFFDPATKVWSVDAPMQADNKSGDAPAMAVYNGGLYCVHKGGNDNGLWWCYYDPATMMWSPDAPFYFGNKTNSPPALAVFNNTLYCVHRGDNDQQLYWCKFTNNGWTGDVAFQQGNMSGRGPSLFVKDGVLNCVHRGQQDRVRSSELQGQLLYACSSNDGETWTLDLPFPNGNKSADSPAVANYNGAVVCVHRGISDPAPSGGSSSDPSLFYATLTAGGWSADIRLAGGNLSADGPALAVVAFPGT